MALSSLVNESKRNLIIALISGIIFFIGWWILIDVASTYPEVMSKNKIYYLPGFGATASMIVVLATPFRTSQDNYFYSAPKCHPYMTIFILFVGLTFSFGSMIWAMYIWIADFLIGGLPTWPGVGIMLQNLFILIANLQLKFAREANVDTIL